MRKPIGQHLVERAVQLLHPLAAAVGRRPHGVQAYRQRKNRTESGLFRDSCSWRTAGSPRASSRRPPPPTRPPKKPQKRNRGGGGGVCVGPRPPGGPPPPRPPAGGGGGGPP